MDEHQCATTLSALRLAQATAGDAGRRAISLRLQGRGLLCSPLFRSIPQIQYIPSSPLIARRRLVVRTVSRGGRRPAGGVHATCIVELARRPFVDPGTGALKQEEPLHTIRAIHQSISKNDGDTDDLMKQPQLPAKAKLLTAKYAWLADALRTNGMSTQLPTAATTTAPRPDSPSSSSRHHLSAPAPRTARHDRAHCARTHAMSNRPPPPAPMTDAAGGGGDLPLRPLEPPRDPLEFLSRSWSASAADVSRALAAAPAPAMAVAAGAAAAIAEDVAGELDCDGAAAAGGGHASGSSFSFGSAATSQLILDRIMAQSVEVSPLTSGRLSHSSGPLNGGSSLSDSPPVSPEIDEAKVSFSSLPSPPRLPALCNCKGCKVQRSSELPVSSFNKQTLQPSAPLAALSLSRQNTPWQLARLPQPYTRGGSKTVGRWLKDRRERKKEETRAHNAQVHAAVSVAALQPPTAAASSGSGKDDRGAPHRHGRGRRPRTLVAAQCVEAAEAMGAEREHLAAAVGPPSTSGTPAMSSPITAAAATALRGRGDAEGEGVEGGVEVAAVIPVEKSSMAGGAGHHQQHGYKDNSQLKHYQHQQQINQRELESKQQQ
ncbi:hypothetical protein HU200_010835 [Digitaria exilis]|uniref:VAN3-binding protein-like auxin canalisation domain-containing protein n=1 Tax=Digitaria exilis TaxID=1010633 RepID=A0A835FJ03_9POAL|nr:hypothetical protein HU200_010835 [Digitaria exilis]